jgi:hypothetical protein
VHSTFQSGAGPLQVHSTFPPSNRVHSTIEPLFKENSTASSYQMICDLDLALRRFSQQAMPGHYPDPALFLRRDLAPRRS